MSKRNSLNSSNTLFNYFAKSPATPKSAANTPSSKIAHSSNNSPLSSKSRTPATKKSLDFGKQQKDTKNDNSSHAKKSKTEVDSNDDDDDDDDDNEDEFKPAVKRKRSRITRIVDSEDSDRENESDNSRSMEMTDTEILQKKSTSTISDSPVTKKKIKLETQSGHGKPSFEDKLKVNLDESRSLSDAKVVDDDDMISMPTVYLHNKLEFLKPDKILDGEKRKPSHPKYDPGTLYVPDSYLNTLTPAMRQWWEIKSKNFDSILFFKVGKFYELYHMDADVGVSELGFTYMRGEFAHSGFPEQSFNRMATSLVDRGYKVARIEQTETPDMMNERVKHQHRPTKYDKVVKREVCQVVNRGTQVFGQQVEISNEYQPNYMLAVVEKSLSSAHRFGIAFIDTSIGEFNIGEFDDDKHCSRLLTLLSHNPPVLVLHERGAISPRVSQVFKSVLSNTLREPLLPDTQFWNAEKTLKALSEKYFNKNDSIEWPDIIRITQDGDDHLGLTPNDTYRLALKALGGCLWYLTKCVIDEQIMAMARFKLYTPPDALLQNANEVATSIATRNFNKHVVLDSITLSNLKIIGEDKSLFTTLDNCCTKFGKRLLNYWVCSPSCEQSVIFERQEAIQELMDNRDLLSEVRMVFGSLPDLERQLAQIHTFGNKNRLTNHPDGRAVLFEQKQYNKKKIQDFVSTINGLDALVQIPTIFRNCSAKLLRRLTQLEPDGNFPDFKEAIAFFKNGFNFEEALKEGVIAPGEGVDKEFDSIQKQIAEINSELATYLKTQEKYFGCRLSYVGNDKKRFELEVPEKNSKKADSSYSLEGQRKGAKPVRRFSTIETRQMLKSMQQAEEQRDNVLRDLQRRMFERFSTEYTLWKKCIDCVAILDCLTSLSIYGQNQTQICFPEVVANDNDGPIIEIDEGYHPCMKLTEDFIPNGITLGGNFAAPLALLTGPNMGGKSTLMRQVGLLVIMGQIGAPIPATSARFSLIDRIFTRLGAQDDILAGQSTFLVELSETSAILKHATVNSLVLLDELGRGTATYDGTAIAAAVVDFLANLKCRTLFSTHYHNLVDNFHNDVRISLGHMACMVENDGDTDDPTQETVTFLYKYTDGACPKSYGFNAAKLAGMPASIIRRAHQYSKKVELIALKRKLLSKVLFNANVDDIKELLLKIKACTI